MDIYIYKTPGCSYCVKIDELMRRANLDYTSIVVGKDITREEFVQKYPQATGYPYTVIDGEPIGGLMQVIKLFVDKKLVSSKTNG